MGSSQMGGDIEADEKPIGNSCEVSIPPSPCILSDAPPSSVSHTPTWARAPARACAPGPCRRRRLAHGHPEGEGGTPHAAGSRRQGEDRACRDEKRATRGEARPHGFMRGTVTLPGFHLPRESTQRRTHLAAYPSPHRTNQGSRHLREKMGIHAVLI